MSRWRFELPGARVLTTGGRVAARVQYESRVDYRLRYNPAVEVWSCRCVPGADGARFKYVMVSLAWKAKHEAGGVSSRQLDRLEVPFMLPAGLHAGMWALSTFNS